MFCVENITESNVGCQIVVLRVQESDQNCWNWIISYIFMQKSEKLEMTPGVFWPQYLSFYMAKIENQGQFWNPQDQQISKLTLIFEFGEDFMEILTKNKPGSFFVDTLYVCYFLFRLCERGGEIFCNNCYHKNFGPRGIGFGIGVNFQTW